MKNKPYVLTAVLLLLSIGNYFRTIEDGSIRTVDVLSIFAMGALAGIFVMQIAKARKGSDRSGASAQR